MFLFDYLSWEPIDSSPRSTRTLPPMMAIKDQFIVHEPLEIPLTGASEDRRPRWRAAEHFKFDLDSGVLF